MTKLLCLLPFFMVVACADTTQGKLRQTIYDMNSTYHVLANPVPDIIAGKVPGVRLTDSQVILIKRASQSVFNELSALNISVQADQTLKETAVAAAQNSLASLVTCWSGLKAGTTPAACSALAGDE